MAEEYSYEVELDRPFAQALEYVENALIALGFTIVTRVDVQRMMQDRMNIPFHPYMILSALDAPVAARALEIDPSLGLTLPCNISIETLVEGRTLVRAADPENSLGSRASQNPQLADLAKEAGRRISTVISRLRASDSLYDPNSKSWDRLSHDHLE